MTIEERLEALEKNFAAMSVAQQAAGDPSGYYTSIYSGEQIDDAIGGVLEGNIPNLSGSTIPVSPSDQTSIATALSKKATNLGYVSSPYETVLDVVLSCKTDSSFFVDNASSLYNATDAPWGQSETQYFVSVDGVKSRRIVFAVLYGSNVQPQIAIRPAYNDAWLLDWTYMPIVVTPQEYSLPLAEGWTDQSGNSCRYAKTQEGICVVTFRAIPNSAIQGGQTTIATLPTGFRPSGLVHGVCIRTDFSSDVIALWLHPDGGLQINAVGGLPEGVGVMGELVFVTVN